MICPGVKYIERERVRKQELYLAGERKERNTYTLLIKHPPEIRVFCECPLDYVDCGRDIGLCEGSDFDSHFLSWIGLF